MDNQRSRQPYVTAPVGHCDRDQYQDRHRQSDWTSNRNEDSGPAAVDAPSLLVLLGIRDANGYPCVLSTPPLFLCTVYGCMVV